MAATAAFLTTCRTAIAASPVLTAFQTAYAALASASRATKPVQWNAVYDNGQEGQSPAYRLRAEIRAIVTSLGEATVTPLDREAAIQTLSAEYVPTVRRPRNAVQEQAALQQLLIEDMLS